MEQMQTTATTQSGTSRREERLMASSITSTTTLETEVRDFAREFPTPNVLRAVALCESGQLSWAEVNDLLKQSLATGLKAVS